MEEKEQIIKVLSSFTSNPMRIYLNIQYMKKQDFCLCENKGADELCSNCTAHQRLCFHFTFPPVVTSSTYTQNFKIIAFLLDCVGPGRKPRRPVFSRPCSYSCNILLKRVYRDISKTEKFVDLNLTPYFITYKYRENGLDNMQDQLISSPEPKAHR